MLRTNNIIWLPQGTTLLEKTIQILLKFDKVTLLLLEEAIKVAIMLSTFGIEIHYF